MYQLPVELKIEIEKFQKNKYGVFIMHSLASNNFEDISFRKFKKSYICKSLELLKWYAKYFQLNEYMFKIVARFGNLKNMKWLKENNCPWDEGTFNSAAEKGVLKNMKWLKENNCPWDGTIFDEEAKKAS